MTCNYFHFLILHPVARVYRRDKICSLSSATLYNNFKSYLLLFIYLTTCFDPTRGHLQVLSFIFVDGYSLTCNYFHFLILHPVARVYRRDKICLLSSATLYNNFKSYLLLFIYLTTCFDPTRGHLQVIFTPDITYPPPPLQRHSQGPNVKPSLPPQKKWVKEKDRKGVKQIGIVG